MERTRDSLRPGGKASPGVKAPFYRELDFLAALVKVMLFILILQIGLGLVTFASVRAVLTLLSSTPLLLIAYIGYKSRNYYWTLAAVLTAAYISFVSQIIVDGSPGSFDALIYLLIPLMIGVLLLNQRVFIVLMLTDSLFVVLASLLVIARGSINSLPGLLIGIEFVSLLALVTKRYWHLLEQDRRAEVAQNEIIFRELITNVPVVLVVLDEQGMITLIEGRALENISFDPSRFIGRSIFEAYNDFPNILQDCRRALGGEMFSSTAEIAGLAFDVWYSPLRTSERAIRGIVVVGTDVTERRRAEDVLQQQASLLQNVSDAIISLDFEFNILTWNHAAEVMYDWLSYEVVGKPISEVIVTEQPEGWAVAAQAQVAASGEWECELLQIRRNGAAIRVLASFSPLEDAEGHLVGTIMVGRDITQRKRAEEQSLELALEREKVKILREFIGDSSHDFRTPLATIRTSAYLLRKKNPDINPRHIDVIENEVDHLGRLVEDLLTLARLDGAPSFEFAPLDINELLEQVIVPIRLLASAKQQTVSYQRNNALPLLRGDAVELERVLVNILTNAITYTSNAGKISVESRCSEKSVIIQVIDTGIGISGEDLPHIFDRFFRVDKTRASRTGGAGLGLAIAQKIVEAHDGEIRVASELGTGTTVTIELPFTG